MKNKLKMVMCFMIGLIVAGTIVYAAGGLTARNIGYSDDTAKAALDDLYKKADKQSIEIKKVCQYQSEGSFGAKGTVGAKYKCQLGAEDKDTNGVIYRYFYILAVNNDNTVDLIMDRNISSGTMTWYNAMKYFITGDGISYKNKWINVLNVDLPKAQAIVDAVERNNWYAVENGGSYWCFESKSGDANCNNVGTYAWLYSYTKNCESYGCIKNGDNADGYWTRDISVGTNEAIRINNTGSFNNTSFSNNSAFGVRPVITLLKSNLYD